MCEKCNEALMAASHSALNLAKAAQILNSFNRNVEADILAKAAAELFTEVKQEEKPEVVDAGEPAQEAGTSEAAGFSIDEENGVIYFGGGHFGRIVQLGQTARR